MKFAGLFSELILYSSSCSAGESSEPIRFPRNQYHELPSDEIQIFAVFFPKKNLKPFLNADIFLPWGTDNLRSYLLL